MPPETDTARTPVSHLPFLDGIRGLAALYVVMHHAWNEMGWQNADHGLPHWLQHAMSFFTPGTFGVSVFIVLSGYCLMLPVVHSADGNLKGGPGVYFSRRARRILPPYYAALGLSVLAYALVPALRHATGIQSQLSSCADKHAFTAALASHVLLVHNVVATWAFKFNSPLWSVATEWQIYFALPFLLLPLWRRFGVIALGATGLLVGLLPHFLLHGVYDSAQHWLLGQFAFGCCAAVICFSASGFDAKLRRLPWGALTAVSLALLLIINWLPSFEKYWQVISILSGVPAACLLIWCWHGAQTAIQSQKQAFIVRLCESPFALWLGKVSYSLYLTHILVVMIVSSLCAGPMSSLMRLAIYMGADTVLALGLAAAFHLLVERHFLNTRRADSSNAAGTKI